MPQDAICVSCVTGAEHTVCDEIQKSIGIPAFYPTWVRELRIKDRFAERAESMLPGYVFVYPNSLSCIGQIARMEKVLRVLQYGDGSCSLYGEDLAFASWILEQQGQVGLSRAMMVGDRMVIIDGPMKHYEGQIKRIDKHNRYAQIKIAFEGMTRTVQLGFQWMTFQDGVLVRWKK